MAEQIMWVVKDRDGEDVAGTRRASKRCAIAAFQILRKTYANDWPLATRHGYSCVRATLPADAWKAVKL